MTEKPSAERPSLTSKALEAGDDSKADLEIPALRDVALGEMLMVDSTEEQEKKVLFKLDVL